MSGAKDDPVTGVPAYPPTQPGTSGYPTAAPAYPQGTPAYPQGVPAYPPPSYPQSIPQYPPPGSAAPPYPPPQLPPPAGTRVALHRSASSLDIHIPRPKLPLFAVVFCSIFSLAWLSVSIGIIASMISHFNDGLPVFFILVPIFMTILFILGLSACIMAGTATEALHMDAAAFTLTRNICGRPYCSHGPTPNVIRAEIKTRHNHHTGEIEAYVCELLEGVKSHPFGASLTTVERQWLVNEVNAFLHALRTPPPPPV